MRDTVDQAGARSSAGSISRAACTWGSSWTSPSGCRPIPAKDIDLALTVLRKRIDEFGVTEPLIQKQGDDRIVVELAGISDPGRAKAIVQKSAFLEFRITDRSQALEKALPAMDRALQRLGVQAAPGAAAATPNAVDPAAPGRHRPAKDTEPGPGHDAGRWAARCRA